ncbi:MAG: hypothetical protein N2376_11175, partial [Clostridia bacterium]|nr:hypothetical protein [Clostridia bacterium]
MEKINDAERLSRYMEHYGLLGLFGQDMLPHMELFYYRKHEAICMAGEEPEYFLLFVEGKAKVYTLLKNGKSLML